MRKYLLLLLFYSHFILAEVNINTAKQDELMTLSGIGQSKSEEIINYRIKNGQFNSIDDIKKVKGIGNGIFEKIKDDIVISNSKIIRKKKKVTKITQ